MITRLSFGSKKRLSFGGESHMPLQGPESLEAVIAEDVFDIPIHLPGHVSAHFKDAMQDPVSWARHRVKNGAEALTLHLISTDPKVAGTPIKDALRTVEDVLQAVDVPLIIGGSGNPEKDPELLSSAAEVCAGENVILSSVGPDMDYRRVAEAAVKHGHGLLSLVAMNPDEMRRMNRSLVKAGVSEDRIVMDLFTGGIGYGVEYSISSMERCRLMGLSGDPYLRYPMASATSNAWSAREAWMRSEEWGPREMRGPLWELLTAEMALLSGAELFMMLDPLAINGLRQAVDSINSGKGFDYRDWVDAR